MYYSYVEFEYVATNYSPARTELALKLLRSTSHPTQLPQLFNTCTAPMLIRLLRSGCSCPRQGMHGNATCIRPCTICWFATLIEYLAGMMDKCIGWRGRPVSWRSFLLRVFPFFEPILFWSLIFGSYWLIVTWCIVLLLHPLPSVLLGLFVHLPFSFSASWLRHELWGGVDSRRYPKLYSRLTLPWIWHS